MYICLGALKEQKIEVIFIYVYTECLFYMYVQRRHYIVPRVEVCVERPGKIIGDDVKGLRG